MEEEEKIQEAYNRLLQHYTKSNHRKKVDVIQKAFNFALNATKNMRRPSGEPYMMHPIAVATIVSAEMGLGSTSICAALLHDVIEESDYTIDDIKVIFGDKIAQIVDGLTKIAGGIFGDKASEQAENFKKLLLTMSEDIRVILIKICDRLDNMRHLDKPIDTSAADRMAAGEADVLVEAPGTASAGEAGSLLGGDCKIYEYNPGIYDGITAAPGSVGIMFITRSGQEGQDQKYDAYADGTPHYLALTEHEKGAIRAAKEACGKVVVVLVTSAPMELSPLMEGELEADAIL